MPERTEQLLAFPNTGLSLMGPKRTTPPTALRRAVGIHDTNVGSLRSRKGETTLQTLAGVYTLGRLDSVRFAAAGGTLYRSGVALITGLNGNRLALCKSPPAANLPDYLFVTGGGLSRKILSAGTVQNWGIAPPASGMAAAAGGGAVVLTGRYWYHSTFLNFVTGNRSNAEPVQAQLLAFAGTTINLSAIPVSADAQVTRREIWRTVGDGGTYLYNQVITNNTATTLADTTLDSIPVGGSYATNALQPIELPLDNAFPDQTYTDAVIDQLTSFWISGESGKQGRLYYSPIGRPEGVKGYVTITNDNDALQRVIAWNGRYVFTLKGVYKIDGADPYFRRLITGVPGVPAANRRTVVPSPYGIFYQAADGLRLFDGARSELIFFDRVGSLFRGETLDDFPLFEGIYAEFARNQYFISDGSRTLAFNYITGFIRELGVGLTSLFYEEDTRLLLGATSTSIVILEDESASAFTTLDIETGSLQLPVGQDATIKRVRVRGQFYGQVITPSIIIDDVAQPLPPFTVDTETIEYPIGQKARSVSIRLQATLTLAIVIETIEVDVYESKDAAIKSVYKYGFANTRASSGSV